ncbi:MAG: NUDIX domain-containing protein [Ruminococcus sp.]|nr:NUDIX domain-containing protein [Ruminococcus sp.]
MDEPKKVQGYNCIMVLDPGGGKLLMCRRRKDPYKGLKNLVGGKIEPGEDHLDAAYRELWEESGLGREDVTLTRLMTFDYPLDFCYVEVYAGQLREMKTVSGDENELLWESTAADLFDMRYYAGEGNIGHMLEILKLHPEIAETAKSEK